MSEDRRPRASRRRTKDIIVCCPMPRPWRLAIRHSSAIGITKFLNFEMECPSLHNRIIGVINGADEVGSDHGYRSLMAACTPIFSIVVVYRGPYSVGL